MSSTVGKTKDRTCNKGKKNNGVTQRQHRPGAVDPEWQTDRNHRHLQGTHAGPVRITSLGLPGDAICDVENHGGADQAIYLYGAPDYAWWSAELGWEVEPGTFGENLTIGGLESAQLQIGDCLHVGAVTLQVTAPRIPCSTLAARMGDPGFVKRFRAAERPGLYCRVLREGTVQVGDAVRSEPYAGLTIPAIELFRTFFISDMDAATLRRHLAAPLAIPRPG